MLWLLVQLTLGQVEDALWNVRVIVFGMNTITEVSQSKMLLLETQMIRYSCTLLVNVLHFIVYFNVCLIKIYEWLEKLIIKS